MKLTEEEIQAAWKRTFPGSYAKPGNNTNMGQWNRFAAELQRVADQCGFIAITHDPEKRTLRDEFAMAALPSVIWDVRRDRGHAKYSWEGLEEDDYSEAGSAKLIAEQAYAMANAMLAARDKHTAT